MSPGLRKFHLVGPHSHHVLQRMTTRDVRKLYPGRSVYACMLNDGGKFTDDCIIYRTGPNSWMVVIGSGTGYEELTRELSGKNAAILFDDDLQDLSLQGPLAVDYLSQARARHSRTSNTSITCRPPCSASTS